ncbi:MAG: hypothetical protein V1827_00180 [Candidatus Micrarchaeota archaeon]
MTRKLVTPEKGAVVAKPPEAALSSKNHLSEGLASAAKKPDPPNFLNPRVIQKLLGSEMFSAVERLDANLLSEMLGMDANPNALSLGKTAVMLLADRYVRISLERAGNGDERFEQEYRIPLASGRELDDIKALLKILVDAGADKTLASEAAEVMRSKMGL